MGSKVDEIKAGGVKGILGLDQIDWGDRGGKIYECWNVSPCCGDPWNVKDCLYCVALWYCCGFCSFVKLYSTSVGNDCNIFPNCLFACCCGYCAVVANRYNLRKKAGVSGNLVGDCVCHWCCGYCAFCQEIRSVPKDDWDFIGDLQFTPKQGFKLIS